MQTDWLARWQTTLAGATWEDLDPGATCRPPDPPDRPPEAGTETGGLTWLSQDLVATTLVPERLDKDAASLDAPHGTATLGARAGLDLGEVLGEGGVARVFLARQRSLDREVAVKVVRDRSGERAFVHEARLSGALDHPNILPVHDLVPLEGAPALVMKRVRGASWAEHLAEARGEETFDLVAELRTLLGVCQGVAFAHAHGVLHLDLKPANVMLGDFGEVFVTDWGCGVVMDEAGWADEPGLPRAREVIAPFGTPAYMPPELARGDGAALGPASDVYLLGAILHELLTGMPPRRGAHARQIVEAAAAGEVEPLPEDVEPGLAALVREALDPDPARRPASAAVLRDRLQHWLDTRESRRITAQARRTLRRLEAHLAGLAPSPTAGDEGPDEQLLELVGAVQQAGVLWPDNPVVDNLAADARLHLARRALDRGEVGLAEVQIRQLPPEHPDRPRLAERAGRVRAERSRAVRTARWQRWGLGGLALVLVGTVAGAFVLVEGARQQAQEAARLADARYGEVLRLADDKRARTLEAEADRLHPATPDRVPAMEDWVARARALLADRSLHRDALEALGAPRPQEPAAAAWRRELLSELVERLERLETEGIPDMQGRLQIARTLRRRSLEEPAEAWARAREAVARDPRYGFDLPPQLGLVPLGPDPETGLQTFVHLLSGDPPPPDAADPRAAAPGRGVVLVLLPGGEASIGAAPGDPVHDDPGASPREGPVHTVRLEPFFLGRHELTQDQWLRITGENPSAYPIGREVGPRVVGPTHPVEQVRWAEATEVMRRVGLTLPTEVQWEYAARAGTDTVFATGDDPASLQGYANLADRWARDHEGPESWRYEAFLEDGHLVHAPGGSLRPNAFGLYDMAGNVWEWCLDRYGAYDLPVAPGTGARRAPARAPRVFRGGGFRATVDHARSADRYTLYAEGYRAYDVGLRAARPVRWE
jgi:formylglycine-generating enzyme required for sulfatase activity